jgi:predicted nucleic acid-binding protein
VGLPPPPRGPIFADTNILIRAQRGDALALAEIRAGETRVTPSQYKEFLNVTTPAQVKARKAFLDAEGVKVYGGPAAGAVAKDPNFRAVFDATRAAGHSRADAALAAFAKVTTAEAVTDEARLRNFFVHTRPRLGVPIRRLPR